LSLPLVLPMEPFKAPLVVLAAELSLQSMWTGLAECSLAAPVSLSASLPALGFLNELQSGFAASFMERVAELGSLSLRSVEEYWDEDCAAFAPFAFEASSLLAAMAGTVTPRAAARAIVLRNWLRIIMFLLWDKKKKSSAARAAHIGCGSAHPPWLRALVRADERVARALWGGPTVRRAGVAGACDIRRLP